MAEKNTAIPNKNTSIPNKEVAGLLAAFDPEVRNLVLATRGFVFQMFPDITEQVDAKARIIGYGYGPKYTDMVCSMMPTKIGVTLGIAYAMELPDPEKLLEGTGKVHRHVKLKSKSDLEAAGLKKRQMRLQSGEESKEMKMLPGVRPSDWISPGSDFFSGVH